MAMKNILDWFERIIVYILIVLMMVIILVALTGFIFTIIRDVARQPASILSIDELLGFFGYILLVLIGLELLDTIRACLMEHVVHVEVVLEVALIAVARKIIILDLKDTPSATLFGIAALVTALAVAFYLEKRGRKLVKKSVVKSLPE
jgi:uncharacterized membrane protein (DUF373 family)